MSDSLTLARRLGALDDGALTELLVRRQVATRDVRDFFDLADALLEPSSVRLALRAIDRSTLEFLAGAGTGAEPRDAAGLSDAALAHPTPDGTAVYESVAATAAAVLRDAPADPVRPGGTEPDARPAGVDRAAAAERAFTVLSAVSELVQQLRMAPLRIRARGGVSATDDKRLAVVLGVDPVDVGALIELATAARLVTVDGDILVSTTAADAWNRHSPGRRWLELARNWLSEQEAPYRLALGSAAPEWSSGASLRSAFAAAFPAADAAMTERLDHLDRVAALLGAAIDGRPSAFGRAALDPAPAEAAAIPLDGELPAEVGQVYLQHDLSVIAPGPLSPTIDSRLRKLADIETRGVASAFRISQQSIDRALASGETELSLRAFLGEISLTGLPQAVDYLIGEGGRRHGLVRVRRFDDPDRGPRTIVHTTDAALLGAIAVDQSLSPLGLRYEGDGALWSRVDATTVYWMLADARYPVLAEDVNGDELVMRRSRIAAPARPGPAETRADAVSELVLRLRSASEQSSDDSTAWMTRLLDKAVRSRTPMTIDVRMPDDSTTQLQVTPLSLQNGRLRCVDVRAGVERTVPVANIVAVTAA
ncbi:helicase-associated domain-containing protein [Herbiconiux sp. 11R-BC]|uniref:helicase-associated domain-containing protein n=1 Tax=Herbiconiux sp. 11R-BC TaxID=3111637 RepID=UPI003C0E6465